MILKLKFKFEKETPGTVRYQEVGADGNPASAPSDWRRAAGDDAAQRNSHQYGAISMDAPGDADATRATRRAPTT